MVQRIIKPQLAIKSTSVYHLACLYSSLVFCLTNGCLRFTKRFMFSFSVYLDYNATTPLDPQVLEEITTSLEHAWGNPSSGYESGTWRGVGVGGGGGGGGVGPLAKSTRPLAKSPMANSN